MCYVSGNEFMNKKLLSIKINFRDNTDQERGLVPEQDTGKVSCSVYFWREDIHFSSHWKHRAAYLCGNAKRKGPCTGAHPTTPLLSINRAALLDSSLEMICFLQHEPLSVFFFFFPFTRCSQFFLVSLLFSFLFGSLYFRFDSLPQSRINPLFSNPALPIGL